MKHSSACRDMVNAGYKLALDDYVPDERMRPLVELASVVKIDVLDRPHADLRGVANHLRSSGVRLLAERVETATVRDMCTDLGYSCFRATYSADRKRSQRPTSRRAISAVMRLLNLLQDPDTPDTALDARVPERHRALLQAAAHRQRRAIGGRGITSIPHAVRHDRT